jgi:hypothetical protein
MQLGVVYHTQQNSFQLVFNLLPPFANRIKRAPNLPGAPGPPNNP